MIYYLKQEVKIGDKVDLNGVKVTLTQQIINDNIGLFEVKDSFPKYIELTNDSGKQIWYNGRLGEIFMAIDYSYGNNVDELPYYTVGKNKFIGELNSKPSTKEAYNRQELLKEAKRRYLVGSKVVSCNNNIFISSGEFTENIYDVIRDEKMNNVVYKYGKWAEIVKPLFKTEDGVDIYEGDELYYVNVKDFITNYWYWANNPEITNFTNYKYFSSNVTAEDWIKANKPKKKSLRDYENLLLKDISVLCQYKDFTVDMRLIWDTLKEREPKLYWIKVLQLIADDLNGDWKPSFTDSSFMWTISSKYTVNWHCGGNEGAVYFATKLCINKAIELMGTNLDYIFK